MANAGVVYARPLGPSGQPLVFGVSGRLWRDSLIMFDRETKSLWSQVAGKSVHGELNGERLVKVSSHRGTWGEWKALHPNTLALAKPEGMEGSRYQRYFDTPGKLGIRGKTLSDSRLPGKSVIYGIESGKGSVAIPLASETTDLLRFKLGGKKVVVLRRGLDATAFEAGDHRLRWSVSKGLRDKRSKRRFDERTGLPFDGQGEGLRLIPGLTSYWFTWVGFHPETRIEPPLMPQTQTRPGAQSRPSMGGY